MHASITPTSCHNYAHPVVHQGHMHSVVFTDRIELSGAQQRNSLCSVVFMSVFFTFSHAVG